MELCQIWSPTNKKRIGCRHYKSRGQRQTVRSAWTTAQYCDVLLLIVDIHRQVPHRNAPCTLTLHVLCRTWAHGP